MLLRLPLLLVLLKERLRAGGLGARTLPCLLLLLKKPAAGGGLGAALAGDAVDADTEAVSAS
jgi:hypothetical protein